MIKLINLELERNKIRSYIVASFLILIFEFGFCFLIAYIPQIEQSQQMIQIRGGASLPTDLSMFSQWNNFISLISILFVLAFGVLSAIMHAKFTVEEYTGKRAILLFSYPIKRSKILFAKCSFVFFFTAIAVAICNIVAISMFAFFSNAFHILPNMFTGEMWPNLLVTTGVSALLAASIGLIAMRVGFWRKSLVATVVTSFLLIIPFGNMMSFIPENSLQIRLIGMVVLLALGLAVFMELLSKVNKMEAL